MKAKPVKLIYGEGYQDCDIHDATHVNLNFPGPVGRLTLPIIIKGTREGSNCWSWNGDTDKPTLRPSILTTREHISLRCHTLVNDGKAQFLDDCSHDLRGQTVDMLEVE